MSIRKSILSRIEYLYCAINKQFKSNGVVLMFHHISDEKLNEQPCCLHTVERFHQIIEYYINEGFEFIRSEDVLTHNKTKKKFVVITFDDGDEDVYLNAYPFLKQRGIPFTVFITNKYLNKQGYISTQQLLDYSNDKLVTIGYHTFSHPLLVDCHDILKETIDGCTNIESLIGRPISIFAYPYGKPVSTGLKSVVHVRKRYKIAFSTINTDVTFFSSLFSHYLPRIVIE